MNHDLWGSAGDRPAPELSATDTQLLIDYLTGELPSSARTRVEQRFATDAPFATLAATVTKIWQTPLPTPVRDVEAGWAAIQRKAAALRTTSASGAARTPLVFRRDRPIHRWTKPRTWLTLAAVVLLGVVGLDVVRHQLYPAYYYRSGTVATAVTLPDGSHAQLAPGSYLGTAHGFPRRSRTVYLYGQATFTVAHTSAIPFVVTVPGVSTRVLGTAFSLQADTAPTVRVHVTQGRVALETADANGHWHAMQVLNTGDAVQVTRLEAWLGQAGYAIGQAGVPFRQAMQIGVQLRKAVIQAGAAAAHANEAGRMPAH